MMKKLLMLLLAIFLFNISSASAGSCNYNFDCETGENQISCPFDCGTVTCNYNNVCDLDEGENQVNCPHDCALPVCIDNDNDGFGESCSKGPDCDDSNYYVNPEALEGCNGIDDNCDGIIDAISPATYRCGISDVGVCRMGYQTKYCYSGEWQWTICTGAVYPSAELCNYLDDDCDGLVDEGNVCGLPPTPQVGCVDNDNDGYCSNIAPADCNDNNALVNPGATELCNGLDDDCDGLVDEGNVCYIPQPEPEPEEPVIDEKPEYPIYIRASPIYMRALPISDFISIGNDAVFFISLKNTGKTDLRNLKISATVLDLDIRKVIGPFDLDKGKTANKLLYINIPEDAAEGEYYLRLAITNDFVHRIKHRILTIK